MTAPTTEAENTGHSTRGHHEPGDETGSPGLSAAMILLTLGALFLLWAWRFTKEVDARLDADRRAHPWTRVGVILSLLPLVAIVLLPVAGVSGSTTAFLAALGFMVLALLLGFVGFAPLMAGLYRAWSKVDQAGATRGIERPYDPALNIVLILVLGPIGMAIAAYQTEDHWNKVQADHRLD